MKRLVLFFGISGFLYGQGWMQLHRSNLNPPQEIIAKITDRCDRELNIKDKKFVGHAVSVPRINEDTVNWLVKEYLITVTMNFENELKKIQWVKFHVRIFQSALQREYVVDQKIFIPTEFSSAFQLISN